MSSMTMRSLNLFAASLAAAGSVVSPVRLSAECCGQAAAPPVATQTYRLDFQTVYDERQVTSERISYETVYEPRTYVVQRPVIETQTTERRYTVQRPVWETQTREERFTVMKPVWETQIQDRSYDVVRDVVETATREERFTVMKPVYETAMQQQVSVVRRPVYETSEREEAYTVAEPVTVMRTGYAPQASYQDQVSQVVNPGVSALGYVPYGWAVDPYTGLATWQRGGYTWMTTPSTVGYQVNRVVQTNYVPVQTPETTYVNRVVTRRVPVQSVRYVDEQVVQQVPVQSMRMVAEEQVRQVPVQTVRKVVERVDNKVPVQVCRMVPEEQVRQVPVQVCRMVAEEKVEPVTTQVTRMVAEQKTVQVARLVEKRTPVTYNVRTPRTVVMRVPLDPCGNPIPAASAAVVTPAAAPTPVPAPAAAAKPAPATLPADASAEPKTYGEPKLDAAPAKRLEEGWTGSARPHVDPKNGPEGNASPAVGQPQVDVPGSRFRVEKPAGESAVAPKAVDDLPMKSIENIPSPTGTKSLAPSRSAAPATGPSVEPSLPTGDVKVEESSTLRPIRVPSDDRTT